MINSVVGIDPGKYGGLALIDQKGAHAMAMPAQGEGKGRKILFNGVRDFIATASPDLVVIERQSTRPNENPARALVIGDNYGALKGVCIGLGVPFVVVTPQTWKQRVFSGTSQRDKAAAIAFCKNHFPHVPLRTASGRGSQSDHDGIADALCIAAFGRAAYKAKAAA